MSSLGGERLASTRAGNQSAPCATHFVNPFERLRLLCVLVSLWIGMSVPPQSMLYLWPQEEQKAHSPRKSVPDDYSAGGPLGWPATAKCDGCTSRTITRTVSGLASRVRIVASVTSLIRARFFS